jgi:hypothetical protein
VNRAGARFVALAAAVVGAGALPMLVGCGGGGERANALRPPAPINLAVQVGDSRVSVSPRRIGAGPITIVASNQSGASRRLTIEGPRLRQSLGPINPQDTATLKVTVNSGSYTISADGTGGPKPAELSVGPKRPSAQNELLLP